MKYWLEFIYTDSLPPNLPKEIYRGLYSAAHTYKNGKAQEYMERFVNRRALKIVPKHR
jgi:hypothetical protein